MKIIMENFRRFSEQACTGGQCENPVPSSSRKELEDYLKKLNATVEASGPKGSPAYKEALAGFGPEIKRIEQKLANLPESQVKEQAGETGPDPLGLRGFGDIATIDGFKAFKGESMKNNQKIYRYLFANLKSARTAKEYTEMAATKSQANKKMLASKRISLVSAEIVDRSAGFGIAINQPKELKVTWNVGRATKDKDPAPMDVAPGLPPQR